MLKGYIGGIQGGYAGGITPDEGGAERGCERGVNQVRGQAAGGIGRGELFAVSLSLCMSGSVLSGGVAVPHSWPGWFVAGAVGLFIWAGQVLWVQLFAGMPLADVLIYACGRAAGRILLFGLGLVWLGLVLDGTIWAVQLWQALGAGGAKWLYALLFLLEAGLMASAGSMALARVALLVVLPALLLVLANLTLTLGGADWANLLPFAGAGWQDAKRGVVFAAQTFAGVSVLPAFWENVRAPRQRCGSLLAAMLLAAVLSAVLAVGCRVVLATMAEKYALPLVQVFRLAQVGHWFGRFEIVGAGLLLALMLVRLAAALGGTLAVLGYLWRVQSLAGRLVLGLALAVVAWGLLVWGRLRADWPVAWDDVLMWAWLLAAAVPWVVALAGWHRCRVEGRTVLVGQAADGE